VLDASPDHDPFASLDRDYGHGIVRVAWLVDRRTRERLLLCGGVELVPHEIPMFEPGDERYATLSSGYFIYARNVVVSARRALRWFEDAADGRCVRPTSSTSFSEPADAALFSSTTFLSEPQGPGLISPTCRVPFVADWHGTPRVRHLIAVESQIPRRLSEAERAGAATWLVDQVHFDFERFPEFWGAVHLIAANPVLRSVDVRLDHDDRGRSSLVVLVVPRVNASLEGLLLIVEEKRPTGLGMLCCVPLNGAVTRVMLSGHPQLLRERIVDPTRGVVYDSPFGMFGLGFQTTFHLSTTERVVAATRPDEDAYRVSLLGDPTITRVEGRGQSAGARVLHQAAAARALRDQSAGHQRWFREREPDAVRALREIVAGLATSTLICDPYFGGDDLHRVVLAIANPRVTVRILASAMHLRRKTGSDGARMEGEHLRARLSEAMHAQPSNPIEIRVMRGKKPPIHDRFIYADTRLWQLGSSINRFGSRGTGIVAVGDPAEFVEDVERVWSESSTLHQWLAARSSTGSS
jgi:hypothetical protein